MNNMNQQEEYKTVKVPAGTKAQTKALNNLAAQGWEVVDKRQLWGAGVATVTLKRPYVAPAPLPAVPNPLARPLANLWAKFLAGPQTKR